MFHLCLHMYTHIYTLHIYACVSMSVHVCMCVCMHMHACVTAVLDIPPCQETSSSSLSHYVFLQACDRLIKPFILL